MQSISAFLPKESTMFTSTVIDGSNRARNNNQPRDIFTELYLRVEACALPIIAALDAFFQSALAACQALIGLITLDSFPTLGTIASAIDHIQLAGQSLVAIPVAIQTALHALVDPTASFDKLEKAITPESV